MPSGLRVPPPPSSIIPVRFGAVPFPEATRLGTGHVDSALGVCPLRPSGEVQMASGRADAYPGGLPRWSGRPAAGVPCVLLARPMESAAVVWASLRLAFGRTVGEVPERINRELACGFGELLECLHESPARGEWEAIKDRLDVALAIVVHLFH